MSSDAPSEIDIRGSILFLGSGFSQGARNIRGNNLPTGFGLKDEFARLLGVDAKDYDLKTLADEVAGRQDLDLYQTLYELFTVTDLQEYQRELLGFLWRRIYTTNYDDSVELGYQKNKISAPNFNYDDPKPKKLPNGSVIHLHGVIRKATRENVQQQLVLNESSYVRQHFEKSLWYDDFNRDLRFCSACFFIGYSLADYHITALLMQNPAVSEKTYFVTRENFDQIFANRVKHYGTILPIGVKGFAALCRNQPEPKRAFNAHALKAFHYLDPFKDRKTLAPPTALEILNLVTFGSFNYQRCLSTLPNAEYVVPRLSLADEAANALMNAKCLLVHSQLGNGKSIFLHILAYMLAERGYQCFMCLPNPLTLQQDLELLKTFKKSAIFFDSYNTAIDLIDQFSELPPETKFIVAVRTGVHDVRFHEIQEKLPSPLHRVNLNGMRKEERNDFKQLLDKSGVRAPNLEQAIDKCNNFREVVLFLYDNSDIKSRIQSEFRPLLADQNFKNVFITSHLLKWIGQDVDAAFLRSVTRRDAYAEFARFREVAGDIFRLDDDENLQVRSAVFSEYLIQNHFTTFDIIECVYSIVLEVVKRKREGRYQVILSSLMQVSNLKRALRNDPHHQGSLKDLFDRLHRDIEVNKEPLFWLQYTILMIDAEDLPLAERFLETAYERAAASPGFRTFQIDTLALRLMLLLEERDQAAPRIARFDTIIEKMELVLSMLGEESHRYYAVRVLDGIGPFVAKRLAALSIDEKNMLLLQFARFIERLDGLSIEVRAQTGADQVRAGILQAKHQILAHRPAAN